MPACVARVGDRRYRPATCQPPSKPYSDIFFLYFSAHKLLCRLLDPGYEREIHIARPPVGNSVTVFLELYCRQVTCDGVRVVFELRLPQYPLRIHDSLPEPQVPQPVVRVVSSLIEKNSVDQFRHLGRLQRLPAQSIINRPDSSNFPPQAIRIHRRRHAHTAIADVHRQFGRIDCPFVVADKTRATV